MFDAGTTFILWLNEVSKRKTQTEHVAVRTKSKLFQPCGMDTAIPFLLLSTANHRVMNGDFATAKTRVFLHTSPQNFVTAHSER